MTAMNDALDPAFIVAVARQVLDHHAAAGTCQRCTPTDCDQTVWALAEIAAHHATRARTDHRPHPLAGLARRTA